MYRIGQSTDIHPLKEGRKLILGGVLIDYPLGLDGHSDADVLLHAIAEAILGALALKDLGHHFQEDDKTLQGISSMLILEKVFSIMDEKGYKINNIDSLILIEEPKLAPYTTQMVQNIAKVLHTDISNVNVKVTRGEKLGFVGNKQGVVAQAIVLLIKK